MFSELTGQFTCIIKKHVRRMQKNRLFEGLTNIEKPVWSDRNLINKKKLIETELWNLKSSGYLWATKAI